MKRLFILLFTMMVLVSGCGGASEFTVKVSGTNGIPFSGSYMSISDAGDSNSRSVDGNVPAEYQVSGSIISVSFQKQSETGSLKVEIIKNGKVVSESETSAAYGVVAVSTQ